MAEIVLLDQFEFHHRLEESTGAALVIFTGPACGACRRLKTVLGQDRGVLHDVKIYEVDAQRDMALTREFEVFHLPAMFLYYRGRFHCELHAEPSVKRIRDAIDAALTGPAQEAP